MIWAQVIRYGPTAALVAGVGLGGWWVYQSIEARGYERGYAAREAEIQALREATQSEIDALTSEVRGAEMKLQEQARAMTQRAWMAEDEARADIDECRTVGPDSVQRLKRRWGDGASGG